MNPSQKSVTAICAALVSGGLLTACSGGSTSSTGSTATSVSATAGAGPTGTGGARAGAFRDPKVVACLKAAGITVPTGQAGGRLTGTARPTGSNFPSGARPTGARPTGGFGANSAQSKAIQTALKACGITLPTGGFGGRGNAPGGAGTGGAPASATPSVAPTS